MNLSDKLDDFLYNEVDILMAMGTSALEGAKLDISAILLDVCYGKVPDCYINISTGDFRFKNFGKVAGVRNREK